MQHLLKDDCGSGSEVGDVRVVDECEHAVHGCELAVERAVREQPQNTSSAPVQHQATALVGLRHCVEGLKRS